MQQLLADGFRLELEDSVLDHGQSVRAALEDHALAMRGPVLVDHVQRVVAQQGLHLGAHGRGIARDVAVDGREVGGFREHALPDVVEVLVGGDREQAEQQAVEQAETGGGVADQLVDPRVAPHDQAQERLDEDQPQPGEPDEEQGEVDRELDRRDLVDEIGHRRFPSLPGSTFFVMRPRPTTGFPDASGLNDGGCSSARLHETPTAPDMSSAPSPALRRRPHGRSAVVIGGWENAFTSGSGPS